MNRTILKSGPGRLYKVFNDEEQPGKILSIYDGDILLFRSSLDTIFKRIELSEETGEEVEIPGIILNLAFTQSLQIETSGEDIAMEWR